MFRDMSRRGVRIVRWHLFPSDAWQVTRDADGTPTALHSAVRYDFDVAARLAAKHDVYLLLAVLPDPQRVPSTWFTDAAQARALAAALRPLFARYANDPHVLGWELVTGAEQLVDAGVAAREQVRTHATALRSALSLVAPRRLAAFGTLDVTRIDTWTGLDADLYTPQHSRNMTGERSATSRTIGELIAEEGVDAPVMIGGFDAGSEADASAQLGTYARVGYAGALAWSWRGIAHPQRPGTTVSMPDDATWRFHHAVPSSGPRSRPLNPCLGPDADDFMCPNLRMSAPSDISLARRGARLILYSTNSVNSLGDGPASLRGRRDGRYTMVARQVLHRKSGSPITIDTEAKLLFKAIPGQYRYWKWNGAARMELWRLDSVGTPIERTVIGPKTVYCLRDLRRLFGTRPGSPPSRVYPACSKDLGQQSVTLGTSVGWSDVYPASYHENWIDVTGLRGCFAYVHIADPTNVIYESNEDDNASRTVVKLPFTGSSAGCPGARAIPTTGGNGIY